MFFFQTRHVAPAVNKLSKKDGTALFQILQGGFWAVSFKKDRARIGSDAGECRYDMLPVVPIQEASIHSREEIDESLGDIGSCLELAEVIQEFEAMSTRTNTKKWNRAATVPDFQKMDTGHLEVGHLSCPHVLPLKLDSEVGQV